MDTGCVKVSIQIEDGYYYEMLSELTGMEIDGQYGLIKAMKELSGMKTEYDGVKDAFASVKMRGYGVVSPKKEDITLEEPVIIKQGGKYGVKDVYKRQSFLRSMIRRSKMFLIIIFLQMRNI